jgi:penicillin-binding protein 2
MFLFDQLKKGDPHLRPIALGVLLGMGLLVAGLWYVQVVSAKRYRADLLEQSLRIVRVPAIRGKILDRNGFSLAENRPSYNLNLYMEEFRRHFRHEYTNSVLPEFKRAHPGVKATGKTDEALQASARYRVVSNLLFQVSSVVGQPETLDPKAFASHYNSLRSLPFPLMRELSVHQVALFTERSPPMPSLALEVQPVRIYPWRSTAAHLLGYVRSEAKPSEDEEIAFQFRLPDYLGVVGVELAFDQQLRGRAGVKSVLVNNLQYRQAEEIIAPPRPGQNVILTIDLPIQRAAERALRGVGGEPRGAAVVLDCRNGDVLAMASVPAFDPNVFTSRISEEEWARLSDPDLRPQFDRAAYGTYMPGSIFKIAVALACLEAGTLKPSDVFDSKGYYQIGGRGRPWRCTVPAGAYDFDKAFYRSCNCYFIDHGLQLGYEKITAMGRRLGFGTRTGLNTRREAAGYFPHPSDKVKRSGSRWMPGDTANLCIGQGELRVTPLQIAVMTAAIANGGRILEPRVVDRIEPGDPDSDGEVIRFASGQIRSELKVDPKHLELVRRAMFLDVAHPDGTGRKAAVDGMQVCAKTGTAQMMEGGSLKEYITWFASFAPYEKPRYVVVAVIEGGDSGGTTCAPVAQDIYTAILQREQRAGAPRPEVVATQ